MSAAVCRSFVCIGESSGIDGAVSGLTTRCDRTSSHLMRLVACRKCRCLVWALVVALECAGLSRAGASLKNLTLPVLTTFVTTDLAEASDTDPIKSVW